MKHKLGIPYMGGKRKIAKNIVGYIRTHNPNAKYFLDLFGGGGAISFEAMQYKQFEKVHYNEFNTAVVNLLLKIRDEGISDEFYEWIDREKFHSLKDGDSWKSGLISTCWSFGNNREKGYLFGDEIEEPKRLLHEIVVNKCDVSRLKFQEMFLEIDSDVFKLNTIEQRRLYIQNFLKKQGKRLDLQQVERIQQIERLQQLKQLQQLEQLQQLQRLQQLEITNLSYEKVEINTPPDETIIYLDPPYENTAKYQKSIDYDLLNDWIKNSSYKIYVSSYEFDLPCVHEIRHSSTLSATNNSKKVIERLFCNKQESINNKLF
jgi:site-specific DNA-adenine methylase